MARTYRLPGSLGGGECEIVSEHTLEGGRPTGFCRVRVEGVFVDLPPSWLTEVTPSLPEEPPVGAYLIGGRLAVRFGGQYGSSWLYAMDGGGYGETPSWDDAWRSLSDGNDSADIVLLVPDPAAGVQPNGEWQLANGDLFEVYQREGVVRVVAGRAPDLRGGALSPDDAEAAGRTLLAAARSARAGA